MFVVVFRLMTRYHDVVILDLSLVRTLESPFFRSHSAMFVPRGPETTTTLAKPPRASSWPAASPILIPEFFALQPLAVTESSKNYIDRPVMRLHYVTFTVSRSSDVELTTVPGRVTSYPDGGGSSGQKFI